MKQNLLGQTYIDEEEIKLLDLIKGKERIINVLCCDDELMACFNKMSNKSIIESFKNINLYYSISDLENKKEVLMKEIESLQLQLEEFKNKEELEENSLKSKIESLKEIVSKLQEKISLQLNQIESNRSLRYGRKHFVFEPVDAKSEIYNQNRWTINEFYNKQVYEYSIMTGLEYEEAKNEFDIISGSLCELVKHFSEYWSNDHVDDTASISMILKSNRWNEEGMQAKRVLNSLLKGVNLPNYEKAYVDYNSNNLIMCNYISNEDLGLRAENAILECENDFLKDKLISLLSNQQDKDIDIKRLLNIK